jgi:hypothetical protein
METEVQTIITVASTSIMANATGKYAISKRTIRTNPLPTTKILKGSSSTDQKSIISTS